MYDRISKRELKEQSHALILYPQNLVYEESQKENWKIHSSPVLPVFLFLESQKENWKPFS